VVTSRHDLSAQEVVTLYRQRWQIELFFRWLKHQLGLLQPLGTSRQALWATILLAAIVAVLAALLRDLQPPAVSRIAWLRALLPHLPQLARSPG
jgi:IS4 transposase